MGAVTASSMIFAIATWFAMLLGLVLALATARKHPRRSTLAAIGLAILIVVGLGRAFLLPYLYGGDFDRVNILVVTNVVAGALSVIGWILLVMALVARERVDREGFVPAQGPWGPGGAPFPPPAGLPPGWPPPGPPGGRR